MNLGHIGGLITWLHGKVFIMKNSNTMKGICIIMFSKNSLRLSAIVIAAVMFFSACSESKYEREHSVTLPGGYSESFRVLDTSSVVDLTEQAYLIGDQIVSPITIAKYFPEKNVVIAIYSDDGFLRAWNIEESRILFESDLGITSNTSAGFTKSGDLVMGAIRSIVQENDYGELAERVGGIGIWESSSGDLVTCIVYPCERTAPSDQWQRHLISGAVFDPEGRWVLGNYETLISVTDITDHEAPYSISFSDIDGNNREVALLTIDSNNNRFATAFIDGEVLVQVLGQKNLGLLAPKIHLGTYQSDSRHTVIALLFSVDGQWLARLQDGNLSIWKVARRNGKLYSEFSISDGKILVFDQSSKLLFIGTDDKIDIWDIEKKRLIREFETPKITSLAMSSDNRLLIWGDKLGAIHIWGVRE